MLAQGAKITNMDDMNPLHVAMSQKNQDIMLSLLKHGADINEADNIGNTTLIKAILYYKDFVGFLLGERANPNIVNKNGENALHYAIKKGNMHVLKLLLEKGAVVDDSIIEVARESRNQEIIDLLCTPVDTLGVYTTIGDTLDDGADS
ncbi:MAG UNVERIFIED_CONTAM: ankyrin repeat domain-containing protein [Rickettsiaceae bacterium]